MPSFYEMIGQDRPRTILQAMLQSQKIPNALLFSGDEGIGKQTLATIFAKTLLCKNPPQEPVDPCNDCLACQKFERGNHPDFFVVEPIESERIKIDQIRDVQSRLIFSPLEAAWKVILIPSAEKMTPEAQNGLLKTLEEPPLYAVLILMATNASLLVSTILSRCQKIAFPPLSFSQVETVLMTRKGWTAQEARLAAALTGGQLGAALSLSVEQARQREEEYHRLVNRDLLAHYDTLFETAVIFSKEDEIFDQALFYLSAYLRDILVLLAVPDPVQLDPAYLVFSWRHEDLLGWSNRMNTGPVTKLIADITAIQQARVRNINRQLALETLLMQMRNQR